MRPPVPPDRVFYATFLDDACTRSGCLRARRPGGKRTRAPLGRPREML